MAESGFAFRHKFSFLYFAYYFLGLPFVTVQTLSLTLVR